MTEIPVVPGAKFSEQVLVRFGATFVGTLLRSGVSFITGLVIARFLGAAQYGDLTFLLSSFAALSFLLDLGSTPAFYTFISRRRRPPIFFAMYLIWTVGVQFVLMITLIGLVLPKGALDAVWVGQPRMLIVLACAASFLSTQLWMTVAQLGEATRKTIVVQSVALLQAVFHLVAVAVLASAQSLTTPVVLWLLIAEFALLAAVVGPRLFRHNIEETGENGRQVLIEFLHYCAPLAGYAVVNCVYSFANRWLLQRFGGSAEQGYFAVGMQFATIALLGATSVSNVFWKELAEARESNNKVRVAALYQDTRRAVYIFAALVSCFLIPYSREVLVLSVGGGYIAAWPTLAVLFLFPIHQSLGQILGTFFFATAETRVYTMFGMATMFVSIPAMWLALAPRESALPGLALGSLGLAATMVVIQIVATNVQSHWLAARHGWPTDYAFQIVTVVLLLVFAWASRGIGNALAGRLLGDEKYRILLSIATAAIPYCLFVIAAAYTIPQSGLRLLMQRAMSRIR